jgi:hypothetical protein
MSDVNLKPLNWSPKPNIGYRVERRADGGMHYTFTHLSQETLEDWREFALEHLLDSDRLTRNLYDLRQVKEIPKSAILYAVEVSSDPSARNVRAAVVVSDESVQQAIEEIAALNTTPGGAELGIFTDIAKAEAWLDRPLTLMT